MNNANENIRRSSRSNKGIHSKRLETEIIESDEPRKKLKVKSSNKPTKGHTQPAYVKIEGESVRCLPCGTTDLNYNEDEDDPNGMMIECDNCHTWQHVKCMFGNKLKKNQIPDDYKCDVCDPLNPRYNNLRRKLSYARYLKLRLGKDITNDDNDNSIIESISSDDDEFVESGAVNNDDDIEYKDTENKLLKTSKANSNVLSDDNLSDDNENNDINKDINKENIHRPNKKKMSKKKIKSPEIEKDDKNKANNTYTYNSIRSRIVKNLELKLVELLPKTNNESILKGKTIGELAKEWAIKLEKEIHEMFPNYQVDHLKYTEKARSLLTNLKISRLVDRVIKGEFTIEQLPKLTTEEMRTPEEKKKAEEFMQKALDQVVIKNDVSNLPKTRLTHRGEEIIGDTDYQFDINDRRINEVEKLKEKKRAEESSNKTKNESDEIKDTEDDVDFHKNIESNINNRTNHNETLHNESDNDDIKLADTLDNKEILDDDEFDNILNDNLKSEENKDIRKEKSEKIETKPKEITKRIVKEKKKEYSKFDLWSGKIGSPELSFDCKIDFIASTSKSSKILENAFRMINENAIENNNEYINKGRLKSRVADEYLDKITVSRDLYLFNVKTINLEDEENQNKFIKLWTYYHSLSRYAVIKNSLSYIKDIYLLALSREKIIDGEEGAITLNNFPSDILMDHLDQDDEECKLYLIFVAQKNMDSVRSTIQKIRKVNPNDNNKEMDDDYDPVLSVMLSKLTNSEKEDNQQSADSELKNLMKNLG